MSHWRWLGLIFLFALGIRVGAAAYWQSTLPPAENAEQLFRLGDSFSYWTLASHIARGEAYEYGSSDAKVFRAPLLPILLAPVTLINNPASAVWYARLLGCLLGAVSVVLVAKLTQRIAGSAAAWLAAAMLAVYPSAIGMSILVLSEMLFIPLMLAYLLAWHSAWTSKNSRSLICFGFLSGLLAGLAVLTRPSWLLFPTFIGGLGILLGRGRKRHSVLLLTSLCGLAITMTPWWIRNAQITDRFVLTTLQVGPSLYDGLHEGATGASDEGMEFMRRFAEEQRELDRSAVRPLESTYEFRLNELAKQRAITWSKQHPGEVARLAVMKFLRTWSLWPDGDGIASTPVKLVITASTFSILLLALWGTWQLKSRIDWQILLCWTPCLYFTLLHMVFVGSIRYREPAMVVLIVLASLPASRLISRWKDLLVPCDESTRTCLALPESKQS